MAEEEAELQAEEDGLDREESSFESELPVFSTIGGSADGAAVEVTVSEDEMIAWGRFMPPKTINGRLLVFGDLVEALQNVGIVSGIQDRLIQEAIFHCNMEKKVLNKVVLARGGLSKGERPAFLKLESHIYNHHFAEEKKVSVDFKEYSPFVIVKKGELLARAVLPREGTPGFTVMGKEIPPGKKDIKLLKPGPHTVFAHGKVFAQCAGRFFIEGDVFDVSDTLEIQAGVDYSTGHIVFPGHIQVGGVVQDGFRLVAGGDITVRETLDASEVFCKGDLTCNAGVIGKKPGMIRVGKHLKALFVENCQVEVLGDVNVSKSILHTRLYCNGNLSMDEGGKLVSSSIVVRGTLSCSQLGNENGPCHVTVGTDFVLARKLDAIRAHYKEEEENLMKVKSRLEEEGVSRAETIENEIRSKMEALVAEMNEISPLLFNDNEFCVAISGKIYPGTVIEMGYARLPIVGLLKAKVFRLAEDKKTIMVEKFTKEAH